MPSLIYHSGLQKGLTGSIDFDTDTFKCMLVTSTYAPNKDTHAFRSDVTNEISGTGYTAGGASATVTVAVDTTNDQINMTLGAVSWASATITARGAVYYKSRGGAASADEIVAYIDFGSDISSTAAAFNLAASTLRIQN